MGNADQFPHDSSYKAFFSDPDMVASLLRDFVPEDFVSELDFSTLEKCSGEYVSDDLRKRHDDVVWRIRWKDSWAYVLLMLEFQSQIDHWMAVRILAYTALLWQDLIRTCAIKPKDSLPPVFPIVIYNGKKPWNAATDIAELLAPQATHLLKYQPRQSYFILDESNVPTDALEGNKGMAAQLIKLECAKTPEEISLAVNELIDQLREPKYLSLRRAFAVWLGRVLLVRSGMAEEISECQDLQEVGAMLEERVTEWQQEYIQQGRREGFAEGMIAGRTKWKAEGRTEGKAEGEAEGKILGISTALQFLLNSKFGSYPTEIQTKISKVTQFELLETLLPCAYTANSLREFSLAVDSLINKNKNCH